MHGPGLPPQQGPQPSSGGVVALRVLFALLPVLSCNFLGWASMLRLAILTRRTTDWVLLGANFALTVVWVLVFDADKTPNTDGWQSDLGAFGLIFTSFVTCIYFLVADIRHHERLAAARTAAWYPAQPAPYVSPQQTQPSQPGYGYPQAQTQPMQPRLQAQPMPQPPQAQPQAPAPGPVTPPRIGQVRAELDELSELLRKQTPPPTPPRPDGEGPAR
ncbi:hypothetical protein HYE82_33725 [Streptomyces sp. BR123]|uniref:hypothetical protein n=1 Tax=Streptomyces sp. BR123 TaxID=2749828 RepID=UPI0015C4AE3F|nr:hypothetical protein [Streptomyces sp. BR123]NXY99253.1 hypothetical protein [Streptomyces sp. BR123]